MTPGICEVHSEQAPSGAWRHMEWGRGMYKPSPLPARGCQATGGARHELTLQTNV